MLKDKQEGIAMAEAGGQVSIALADSQSTKVPLAEKNYTVPILDIVSESENNHRGATHRIRHSLLAYSVAAVQFFASFHLYGMAGVFQNYLQNPLPLNGTGTGAPATFNSSEQAGALDRGEAAASGLQSFFWTIFFLFPIVGAVLADSKYGRYRTLLVSCIVSLIGSLIILVTSLPPMLQRGAGYPGWILGSIIMAMGAGAMTCKSVLECPLEVY